MPMPSAIASVYAPPRPGREWTIDGLLGVDLVRTYSLGRWALVDALKACGAVDGAKVLLPAFLCRDLLASLAETGAEPAFYPVGRDLGMEAAPQTLPDAAAIVAVDYFGFPQDLGPHREYARRTGAALIEDNAHGLFSRDEAGAWLGTRGDLGFFSLRKTLPLPDGAALVSTGRFALPPQRPCSDRTAGRLKAAARRLSAWIGPTNTRKAIEAFRLLRAWKTGSAIPEAPADAEERIPLPPEPCPALGRLAAFGDPALEADRRRRLYLEVGSILRPVASEPIFLRLPEGAAPYGFPFLAAPSDLPLIERTLARQGLSSLPWPDLPSGLEGKAFYRRLRLVHFRW